MNLSMIDWCFCKRKFFKITNYFMALCLLSSLGGILLAAPAARAQEQPSFALQQFFKDLEQKNTDYEWKDIDLKGIPWEYHRVTKNAHPMFFAHFGKESNDCILFLGGVHGDELPTVYLMLKLARHIQDNPEAAGSKCIVIAPLVNPDGYMLQRPTRVNANGVDLNRNFPTNRWHPDAHRQWKKKYRKNRRYYPGSKAGSEQETMFQVTLIKRFKPQKILSAHSPLNFFDYDGPSADLGSFEKWMEKICQEAHHPLKKFGYFPGSLGNYAGRERNIFTLTLELPTSNPKLGGEYFRQFLPSFVKFINLSVTGSPPDTHLVKSNRTKGEKY